MIAAVNGACAGVGLALAVYCDLRFVSAAAKLTTAAPQARPAGRVRASWVLPRLVGVTRAADLLLSGRVVTGADTAGWGLWNGVRPTASVRWPRATAAARQLATTVSPASVAATKRQLYDDLLRSRRRRLGRGVQAAAGPDDGSADYREGVQPCASGGRPVFCPGGGRSRTAGGGARGIQWP